MKNIETIAIYNRKFKFSPDQFVLVIIRGVIHSEYSYRFQPYIN